MVDPAMVTGIGLIMIGAGLAIGIAGAGSGMAQGMAAAAAAGGVAEKDYSFGKILALVAMPETQAIYGFVIAILMIFVVAAGLGAF